MRIAVALIILTALACSTDCHRQPVPPTGAVYDLPDPQRQKPEPPKVVPPVDTAATLYVRTTRTDAR